MKPIQWVPWTLTLRIKSGWIVKLTTQLELVLRLRMCGAVPPFPQHVFMALCLIKPEIHFHGVVLSEVQEQLYLYLYHMTY